MFAASKTDSASTGGYEISRSLRFNSADTAYLNRTPASASNQQTWTWSAWVKRSTLGTLQTLFGTWSANNDAAALAIIFGGGDTISVLPWTNTIFTSTAVFRDPSAWYHIVVAFNSTQATASNRVIVYVNGVNQAGTYPLAVTQNANYAINSAQSHRLGDFPASGFNTFGGYMTEINFIDGQALTPSSFGETNAQTGVWQPKAYSGSYGTNGFYLNFSDNSNTTAATLGKDYSGNGNNWTPNNFSVTSGAGNDSLVDSPTQYGFDTGVGGSVRGNYATLNALNNVITLSNGNLNYSNSPSSNKSSYSTIGVSSGKWYAEAVWTTTGGTAIIGVALQGYDNISTFVGGTLYSYGYEFTAFKYNNGSNTVYGSTWTNGDAIGVALDLDAGTVTFYKNGVSQGVAYSGLQAGTYFIGVGLYGSTGDINFGQRPFAYTAPSGFKALCTQNLPTPTVGATTMTQAGKFFNPVLFTGDGNNPRNVTGVGFQPDFVWVKRRDGASNNFLQDAVRGVTSTDSKSLVSNNTDAETNYYTTNGGVTAFISDGFTTSGGATNWNLNFSGNSMVAWNWKANGSGTTNTAGSITSTVSANTTAGFSVVTYTGNATSGATVGHGLGVAPSMIILKIRSTTGNWPVYHVSNGNTKAMYLDLTNGTGGDFTGAWNNTSPTSTVFTLGNSTETNASGGTFVAYCFAEIAGYSKFTNWIGNGSSDGPFVYTGFKPAYVLVKLSSAAGENWWVFDNKRNAFNLANNILSPSNTTAEAVGDYGIDMVSNGFKIRNSQGFINASGATYICAAFAENPFKYSLAR